MCIYVKNTDFEVYGGCDDFLTKSFTGYLIQETLEFRNGYEDINCLASGARKLVAEIAFPILALAAVVEGAVRVAFSLLAIIPALLCCGGKGFDTVVVTGATAFVFIFDLFLRCMKGFLINFCYDGLEMEDLAICVLNPPGEDLFRNSL